MLEKLLRLVVNVHHLDNRRSVRIVGRWRTRIRAEILGESLACDWTARLCVPEETPQDQNDDEAAKHDKAAEIDATLSHYKQPNEEKDEKDEVGPPIRFAEILMPVRGFRIPLAK